MECQYKLGYEDALIQCLVNTKELINELGEEQGLKALRDWLKHELRISEVKNERRRVFAEYVLHKSNAKA